MRFPAKSLQAAGGEIYSHIHENQLTGLKRNLFWSVFMEFKPIRYAGCKFQCAMLCDWIPWAARDWRQLDGSSLEVEFRKNGSVKTGPKTVEASFYMTEHDQARRIALRLRLDDRTKFTATMKMIVDFHGYADGDKDPNLPAAGRTKINYFGLIIVKDNLRPKLTTESKALAVAEKFTDLSTYRAPVDEGWRWVFKPRAFRK